MADRSLPREASKDVPSMAEDGIKKNDGYQSQFERTGVQQLRQKDERGQQGGNGCKAEDTPPGCGIAGLSGHQALPASPRGQSNTTSK
ncbi:MAG: hypothetical protein Q8P46_10345 [Hyphomicrobiales bacterium]|nr:hypothetical protein [Hyphomicrobiales bacterium]